MLNYGGSTGKTGLCQTLVLQGVSPSGGDCRRPRREDSKDQFAEVVAEFSERITVGSYSLAATRGDVDFMLWKICPTLEPINELLAQINRTRLGQFLTMPHSYLSMTRKSPYVDGHEHQGQEGAGSTMRILGRKYLFIYPFVKTHEWYQLPMDERRRIMSESTSKSDTGTRK